MQEKSEMRLIVAKAARSQLDIANAAIESEIEILEPSGPLMSWIRSEFPVKSLSTATDIYIKCLSEVLAHGVFAKQDPSHRDLFEVVVGDMWFYFHISKRLK